MFTKLMAIKSQTFLLTRRIRLAPYFQVLIWGILLLVCIILSLKRVLTASHTPTDFCTDYVAAQRVLQGIQPYLPLHCWSAINPFPFPLQEYDSHPPSSIMLLIPMGLLPRNNATLLWGFICLAAYITTGWLLLRELGWGSLKGLAIFMLLSLGWAPFIMSENFLNLTQVLTLLLVASWVLWRRGYSGWAGGLLGLGGLLKIWPAMVLVNAVLRRQWRTILVGGPVLVLGTALPLVVMGVDAYTLYLGPVQLNENYNMADAANSSLVALLARPFLGQTPEATPLIPVMSREQAIRLGEVVAGLLFLCVLVLIWWRGRQIKHMAAEGLGQGLLVTMLLLIFPVSWYWTLLPVIFPCATTLLALREVSRPPRWWFVLLILGLAQPAGVGWLAVLLAIWIGQHHSTISAVLEVALPGLPACGMLVFAGLQAWLLLYGKWNTITQQSANRPIYKNKKSSHQGFLPPIIADKPLLEQKPLAVKPDNYL